MAPFSNPLLKDTSPFFLKYSRNVIAGSATVDTEAAGETRAGTEGSEGPGAEKKQQQQQEQQEQQDPKEKKEIHKCFLHSRDPLMAFGHQHSDSFGPWTRRIRNSASVQL